MADPGSGFEMWRVMVKEWEPAVKNRWAGLLVKILNTKFPGKGEDEFEKWEAEIKKYLDQSGEQIAESIGADRLFYQRVDDLLKAVSIGPSPPSRFDASCFDANYVTGRVSKDYLDTLEQSRNDEARHKDLESDETMGLHNQI